MSPNHRSLTFAAWAVLLVLGGCSSPPPVRLHTLMPLEPPPRAAAGGTQTFVALEPIRLPAQVDQPQWLVRLPDGSVASLEQERWASPLRDELRQALLEEMSARFGIIEGRSTSPAALPPMRLALELRRLDSIPGHESRIEGFWTVAVAGAPASVRCPILLREAAVGGMPELAAAHRHAVMRLADAMGASVLALQSGASAACPAADPS